MKLKQAVGKNSVLFSSKEDYVEFIKDCGELMFNWHNSGSNVLCRTHFRCIEDIEAFFGIYFGNDPDNSDEDSDLEKMKVIDESVWPTEYPCLLVTTCLECISDGNSIVKYMEEPYFIYQSDFVMKE